MPSQRNRAFIVIDLDQYDGHAADLAAWVTDALAPHDVTVYATLDDMLHDKAAGLDMFAHHEEPIPLYARH